MSRKVLNTHAELASLKAFAIEKRERQVALFARVPTETALGWMGNSSVNLDDEARVTIWSEIEETLAAQQKYFMRTCPTGSEATRFLKANLRRKHPFPIVNEDLFDFLYSPAFTEEDITKCTPEDHTPIEAEAPEAEADEEEPDFLKDNDDDEPDVETTKEYEIEEAITHCEHETQYCKEVSKLNINSMKPSESELQLNRTRGLLNQIKALRATIDATEAMKELNRCYRREIQDNLSVIKKRNRENCAKQKKRRAETNTDNDRAIIDDPKGRRKHFRPNPGGCA